MLHGHRIGLLDKKGDSSRDTGVGVGDGDRTSVDKNRVFKKCHNETHCFVYEFQENQFKINE